MADKTAATAVWAPRALYALYALCAVLLIGEFIIHRHAYFAFEATPLFFVFLGLMSFALCLVLSRVLHGLVSRRNDYYAEDDNG